MDDPLAAAVRNNADWCAAVCRSHGVGGSFDGDAWVAAGPAPTYYPEAVTLAPGVDVRRLVAGVPRVAGGSIKDSYASIDLAAAGFRVLVDASWIVRAPAVVTGDEQLEWSGVGNAAELAGWVDAWRGDDDPVDVFRPSLLDDPAVTIVAGRDDRGRIAGGAAWYRSAGVLGVSNVFGSWPGLVRFAADRHPGATLVGYESGADLDAALVAGFEPIGPLRVWVHDS